MTQTSAAHSEPQALPQPVCIDLDPAFVAACVEMGLDPRRTTMLTLECARQGRDPATVTPTDLDAAASALWTRVRRLIRAA